jgi:hypothetical protein
VVFDKLLSFVFRLCVWFFNFDISLCSLLALISEKFLNPHRISAGFVYMNIRVEQGSVSIKTAPLTPKVYCAVPPYLNEYEFLMYYLNEGKALQMLVYYQLMRLRQKKTAGGYIKTLHKF